MVNYFSLLYNIFRSSKQKWLVTISKVVMDSRADKLNQPYTAPLIVVCGATGTGKSKLGIQLAKHFNGEVINADALQLYKGLDIVTNKVTDEEMDGVAHHLLGILDPTKLNNNIHHFRQTALPLINRMLQCSADNMDESPCEDKKLATKEDRCPVVVGGTFYYLESLLWHLLVDAPQKTSLEEFSSTIEFDREFSHLSNEELLKELVKVDASAARLFHPNDRRKIARALEVFLSSGVPLGQILANQNATSVSRAGQCRFPPGRVLLFWVDCDRDVLYKRVDDRVDDMLRRGLLNELEDFHVNYNLQMIRDSSLKYTTGIFQTIGFKEFSNYLHLASSEEKQSPHGQRLYHEGVEKMKTATRNYAKRQLSWLRNRFLARPQNEYIPVYRLNATDVSLWDTRVLKPALQVVQHRIDRLREFGPNLTLDQALSGDPLTPEVRIEPDQTNRRAAWHCPQCDDKVMQTEQQYHIHMASKKHAKRVAKMRRDAARRESEGSTESCGPCTPSKTARCV